MHGQSAPPPPPARRRSQGSAEGRLTSGRGFRRLRGRRLGGQVDEEAWPGRPGKKLRFSSCFPKLAVAPSALSGAAVAF